MIEAGLGAELRILMNYLKRMEGDDPECSVQNFWEVLKRQFITVSYDETAACRMKENPDNRLDENGWKGVCHRNDNSDKCFCYNWDFTKWLLLMGGVLQTGIQEILGEKYKV